MRLIICSLLLLTACAAHDVRCDGHLQPINLPATSAIAGVPTARGVK
jgi:hypothetical protein